MLTEPTIAGLLVLALAIGFALGIAFRAWRQRRSHRELAQSLDWHAARIINERDPQPRWFQLLKWAQLQTEDERLLTVLRKGPAWGLYVKDPRANDHLLVIDVLTREGLTPEQITEGLNHLGLRCLANDGVWTAQIVQKLVEDFELQGEVPSPEAGSREPQRPATVENGGN
jgi:hypothetical protein